MEAWNDALVMKMEAIVIKIEASHILMQDVQAQQKKLFKKMEAVEVAVKHTPKPWYSIRWGILVSVEVAVKHSGLWYRSSMDRASNPVWGWIL